MRRTLYVQLSEIRSPASSFGSNYPGTDTGQARWVKPILVGRADRDLNEELIVESRRLPEPKFGCCNHEIETTCDDGGIVAHGVLGWRRCGPCRSTSDSDR
jgi:hypothetical protein